MQPVLGAEGFTTDSLELLETEGRVSLIGEVCVQWAMVGRSEAYAVGKGGRGYICMYSMYLYMCKERAGVSCSHSISFQKQGLCNCVRLTVTYCLLSSIFTVNIYMDTIYTQANDI